MSGGRARRAARTGRARRGGPGRPGGCAATACSGSAWPGVGRSGPGLLGLLGLLGFELLQVELRRRELAPVELLDPNRLYRRGGDPLGLGCRSVGLCGSDRLGSTRLSRAAHFFDRPVLVGPARRGRAVRGIVAAVGAARVGVRGGRVGGRRVGACPLFPAVIERVSPVGLACTCVLPACGAGARRQEAGADRAAGPGRAPRWAWSLITYAYSPPLTVWPCRVRRRVPVVGVPVLARSGCRAASPGRCAPLVATPASGAVWTGWVARAGWATRAAWADEAARARIANRAVLLLVRRWVTGGYRRTLASGQPGQAGRAPPYGPDGCCVVAVRGRAVIRRPN